MHKISASHVSEGRCCRPHRQDVEITAGLTEATRDSSLMSAAYLLGCIVRMKRKHVALRLAQQRRLSGADTVNALRPFYFAVHPDFFCQYPREREVNENSLQKLNGYLERLNKFGGYSIQPVKLTFYVRDTKDNSDVQKGTSPPGFRSVSFTLHTNDVLSTVKNILRSCSLPTDHVMHLKATPNASKRPPHQSGSPFYRPVTKVNTSYTFSGFRDFEPELQHTKIKAPTLSLWLKNNAAEAMRKQIGSLPRVEELNRLKKEICYNFNLTDIRWQRGWGLAHRCSQLQSLTRLAEQNPEALNNLQGLTLEFADQSGMNAFGHIMLGTMDVHHQWTKLFEQAYGFSSLLQQTEWMKERIRFMLGGAEVILSERFGSAQGITEHYTALSVFHENILSQCLRLHPRSLQGLSLLLENDPTEPSLHEMGHFIIPIGFELSRLQFFLKSNAIEARRRTQHRNQMEAEEEATAKLCIQKLSLRSLTKEPGITTSQMILCCQRLLEERFPLMEGLNVCVSNFFSVKQDGDICIPWDWKS